MLPRLRLGRYEFICWSNSTSILSFVQKSPSQKMRAAPSISIQISSEIYEKEYILANIRSLYNSSDIIKEIPVGQNRLQLQVRKSKPWQVFEQ